MEEYACWLAHLLTHAQLASLCRSGPPAVCGGTGSCCPQLTWSSYIVNTQDNLPQTHPQAHLRNSSSKVSQMTLDQVKLSGGVR